MQKEFDNSLADNDVHILVPLTGTGTFMTRFAASIPEVSD